MPKYKYKAFISYRHCEFDSKVAEKLQLFLEYYIPPKPIKKKGRWRVFRDETELPTSSDLGADINNALENSEYLICICSERYVKSKWCKAEIDYFKKLHKGTTKNILTLLISGEPKDSFFPTLMQTREEVKIGGVTVPTNRVKEIEPLAANICADSIRHSMQKLKVERLRIAAPMLGCEFDDLYRRHERRQKIILLLSFILLVAISVISISVAFSLNRKNQLIEMQKDSILEENSIHLSKESERLFENGDVVNAIKTALKALPSEGNDRPVTCEAECVLAEEIGAYEATNFMPTVCLKHETTVQEIEVINGGKNVVSQDTRNVYFWDAKDGRLIKTYPHCRQEILCANCIDDIPQLSKGLGSVERDFEEKELADDEIYIYDTSYNISKLDLNGDILWTSKADTQYEDIHLQMQRDIIIRVYSKTVNDSVYKIEVISPENGMLIKTIDLNNLSQPVSSVMTADKDHLIFFGDVNRVYNITDNTIKNIDNNGIDTFGWIFMGRTEGRLYTTDVGKLYCYDIAANKFLWASDGYVNDAKYTYNDVIPIYAKDAQNEKDFIGIVSGNAYIIVDVETGKKLKNYTFDGLIIKTYYSKNGFIFIITDNGKEYYLSINQGFEEIIHSQYYVRVRAEIFRSFPSPIYVCGHKNHLYAAARKGSDLAYVYEDVENEDLIQNAEIKPKEAVKYTTDNYIIQESYERNRNDNVPYTIITMTDTKTGDEITKISEPLIYAVYSDNNSCILKCKNGKDALIKLIDINGNIKDLWDTQKEEMINWNYGYAVSEYDGKTALCLKNKTTGEMYFTVRDFDGGEIYPDIGMYLPTDINGIVWLDNGSFVVEFNGNALRIYTAEGEILKDIPHEEIRSGIRKVYSGGNGLVIILTYENKLYELYASCGLTGRSVSTENVISLIDERHMHSYTKVYPAENYFIFSNTFEGKSCLIDKENFKIRYYTGGIKGISEDGRYIQIDDFNTNGYFPVYTTDELINKAEKYLSRLAAESDDKTEEDTEIPFYPSQLKFENN